MKKNELNSVGLFRDNHDSLHNLSYDSAHNEYMTDSERQAISFDQVKRKYCNGFNMSEEKSESVDAVFESSDGIVFVEFKNGDARREKQRLRDKGNESIMIFCDLMDTTISDTRQYIDYIVVYNEGRTTITPQDRIRCARQKQSHLPDALFDLGKHEGLCFRHIQTMDRKQFNEWLQEQEG